jgi:hypothetical protein
VIEESEQIIRAKVNKIKVNNWTSMAFSQVPEKKDKSITVAAYCFRTETSCEWQVFGKEGS